MANIAYLSCQRSFRWAAGARAAKEIRLGPIVFAAEFRGDKKKRHPNKFDADICGYIARDRRINKETVRRKLQDARNPARNSALAAAVETLTLKQKDEASAKHVAWTETDEQKARAECLQEVLTNADKLGLSKLSEKTPRISLKYSVRGGISPLLLTLKRTITDL